MLSDVGLDQIRSEIEQIEDLFVRFMDRKNMDRKNKRGWIGRMDRKNKRGPSYLREDSGVQVWRGLGVVGGFGSEFARGFALYT